MKTTNVFLFLLTCLVVSSPSQAQNVSERILFKGIVVDGPFENTTIDGYCKRKPHGDNYLQTTKCVVKMGDGYKIVDPQASIQIVGDNRALRIILGPSMETGNKKGNYKLTSFQATTIYDREISLVDIPRDFFAVEVSIGGVAIAGGTATTNPDCLIWDIAGDGAY